jgi:hypothetical protein
MGPLTLLLLPSNGWLGEKTVGLNEILHLGIVLVRRAQDIPGQKTFCDGRRADHGAAWQGGHELKSVRKALASE